MGSVLVNRYPVWLRYVNYLIERWDGSLCTGILFDSDKSTT